MIHIIVYSTTNTAAKMYKKEFQNNSGGKFIEESNIA